MNHAVQTHTLRAGRLDLFKTASHHNGECADGRAMDTNFAYRRVSGWVQYKSTLILSNEIEKHNR